MFWIGITQTFRLLEFAIKLELVIGSDENQGCLACYLFTAAKRAQRAMKLYGKSQTRVYKQTQTPDRVSLLILTFIPHNVVAAVTFLV